MFGFFDSVAKASFLSAYTGLWKVARPLLRRHKRLAQGFEQRLLRENAPFAAAGKAAHGPVVWVQAASGGEARLTNSLVRALADLAPQRELTLLATSCTRQGLDILEAVEGLPDSVRFFSGYFPLDEPALMEDALEQARPTLLVLLETELWPGLLAAAAKRRIPVLLLNARVTPKSFSGYQWLGPLWRAAAPRRVLAVTPEDAARFAALFGAEKVGEMRNIKFDLTAQSLAAQADTEESAGHAAAREGLRRLAGLAPGTPVALLASVRREEEDLLLPVAAKVAASEFRGLPSALIIAPRHMERIPYWKKALAAAGLSPSLASEGGNGRLVIWDRFGDLPALYGAADACFVGGSLAPLGGQNFLEPLSQGLSPFVGPSRHNFLWAGEELFTQGLARTCRDAAELNAFLLAALEERALAFSQGQDPDAVRAKAAAAVRAVFGNYVRERTGGSQQAAEAVSAALEAPAGLW